MSYKIKTIKTFEKNVKKLKKRYPKIKNDLANLVTKLKNNPRIGVELGHNIFKIRIPNSSIPTGSRSGFRVITYYFKEETIYLITIYSKNELDNILTEEIKKIIDQEVKGE